MYSMPDVLVKISAGTFAFFFSNRFMIPTNLSAKRSSNSRQVIAIAEVPLRQGSLRGVSKAAFAAQGESFDGDWSAGEIASQAFEALAIVGVDGRVVACKE